MGNQYLSPTHSIQALKSSTFYSSCKSSLMRYISTSSELLSLSCYFIFGFRCRLCRLWVQTVQQRAGKDLFGCRLCRLWVQTVQQRARNEFIWVQTGSKTVQRARNEFIWVQTVQTLQQVFHHRRWSLWAL